VRTYIGARKRPTNSATFGQNSPCSSPSAGTASPGRAQPAVGSPVPTRLDPHRPRQAAANVARPGKDVER
jgi:hypothetical protein